MSKNLLKKPIILCENIANKNNLHKKNSIMDSIDFEGN